MVLLGVLGASGGAVLAAAVHGQTILFVALGAVLPVLKVLATPQHLDAWRSGAAGVSATPRGPARQQPASSRLSTATPGSAVSCGLGPIPRRRGHDEVLGLGIAAAHQTRIGNSLAARVS